MPARTSAPRPSRSASSPAAEQWFAICSATSRPPVAMSRNDCCQRFTTVAPLAGAAEHEPHAVAGSEVDVVGAGPEVDVVAEHQGRFVAVDRAAHVGEQADVVQHGELGGVEPETVAEPHAEPRRADHVLRGLTETEVGRHRDRDEHLVEPDAGRGHSRTLPNPSALHGVNASWLPGAGVPTFGVGPARGYEMEERHARVRDRADRCGESRPPSTDDGGAGPMTRAAISLTTGLEDPEKVTVALLVAVGAAEGGRDTLMFLTKEAVRLATRGSRWEPRARAARRSPT